MPLQWDSILGDDFQKILFLEKSKLNEFLSLWHYKKYFICAIEWNSNGKDFFANDPTIRWMTSFVTSFMMACYH